MRVRLPKQQIPDGSNPFAYLFYDFLSYSVYTNKIYNKTNLTEMNTFTLRSKKSCVSLFHRISNSVLKQRTVISYSSVTCIQRVHVLLTPNFLEILHDYGQFSDGS